MIPHSNTAPVSPATVESVRVPLTSEQTISPAQSLLTWLLDSHVLMVEEWEELPAGDRTRLSRFSAHDELLAALAQRHLLTPFQVEAIREGDGADLVLGNYRLLDLLGRGGMGTVYRGEHLQLRREVAVKVMTRAGDANPRLVSRFYAEARAVARLQHPNIVTCFDAGRHTPKTPGGAPR
jgi:eukaryotic-like serine/threonine-protein kinase